MAAAGTLFGYRIDSDFPVQRLRAGPGPRGTLTLREGSVPAISDPFEQFHDPLDGRPFFSVARAGAGVLAWWVDAGAFCLQPDAGRIVGPSPQDPGTWSDRVLNGVVPLLLAARGELMVHACAVGTAAGAVLICGPSRRGKSTLAASLAAHGLPVLAEDGVAVTFAGGEALAWPGPVGVRLRPDTAAWMGLPAADGRLVRGKHLRLDGNGDREVGPVPVAAVVTLDPRDEQPARVTRMPPAEALTALFPSVLRLERATWQAAFSRAGALVRRVPAFRAKLQDDLPSADRQAVALLDAVSRAVPQAA